MKITSIAVLCVVLAASSVRESPAGGARISGKSTSLIVRPLRSSGYFAYPYVYPQYFPDYLPTRVVSPYVYPSYVVPTIVATWPYFCALHNEGFVSRVGLLDHLAGTHKVPLDAAVNFCPDGSRTCLFPPY
ncbi:MAG TPA: hypothetical protein VNM15_07015 [Candidatus Binatia bacterium]|nr:hypothetical protein [Candidatus Binatia bacterium]